MSAGKLRTGCTLRCIRDASTETPDVHAVAWWSNTLEVSGLRPVQRKRGAESNSFSAETHMPLVRTTPIPLSINVFRADTNRPFLATTRIPMVRTAWRRMPRA
eukprot:2422911-Rhodomonas_salina.1